MAVLNASDGGRNLQHMAAELYEVDVSLAPSIVKVPAVDCGALHEAMHTHDYATHSRVH